MRIECVLTESDEYTAKADCEKFFRRLRLKAHFTPDPTTTTTPDQPTAQPEDPFKSLKPTSSSWTPPPGKFAALDYYVSKCRSELNKLDFKQRVTKPNLSREERNALLSLRQRTDIVVKPADKGGAVVVWARDLYLQEAERHLSDTNFYQKLDHDHTTENNEKVIGVVKEAISKGELPAMASNLIVEHPRTSKFYLLPKIHKPGNPGRPIVSACNCPTELLATYLDKITTPLVESLPSYVKDTNHMLDIAQSFRFSGPHNYVFTMDVKSLYTVIPNNDGLLALTPLPQQTGRASATYPYPCAPRGTRSHSQHLQFQRKLLPTNRRCRDGKQVGAELCVFVRGPYRKADLPAVQW